MSLFRWSTPERRKADQILPIIPNEIYIYIFECIVPPTRRLAPGELEIFTHLSRVCRFFANFCLPRIFEFVELSGSIFGYSTPAAFRNDAIYKASRGATLCTQIAAKQPLALSLAKRVTICHFRDWLLDDAGSWAVRLFAKQYITGLSHMKNIRELKFSGSFVDAEHWRAIATLESLEELSFDSCEYLEGPDDVEPEQRVKVKVSRLRVTDSTRHPPPVAAIDPWYLRTLAMDAMYFDQTIDWLPQSALTELHCFWRPFTWGPDWYLEQVHTVLMLAPQSVEALWLCVDVATEVAQDMARSMFDLPAWKNLPLLRSLTLQVFCERSDIPANVLSFVLDCLAPLADLQSITLKDYGIPLEISPTEARRILHDKLGPSCRLTYADIWGGIFRFVDGEWSQVSCGTAE